MSVTGHKETIDHVEPLEELLEGLAVEAFEEMLCQFLVGFSSVNALPASRRARQRCVLSLPLTSSTASFRWVWSSRSGLILGGHNNSN